ncbi:MAG: sulfatase [Saprospiraceae bacterium]|nr:sulfatase [Saprospiraceae bacterium]
MKFLTPCLIVFSIAHALANGIEHPNVLFILVDDLGWADLGYTGSTYYESPHVDKLAREGMIFSNFYAGGPVCSPTRASILTGKSTARTGITTYLINEERDAPYVTHALPLEEYTIAEAFQSHGYKTGYIGKWHLGYKQPFWAAHQGFNIAVGGSTSKLDWLDAYPDLVPPVDRLETLMFSPYHFTHMDDGPNHEYLTDRLTDETIKFIKSHKDMPFFAFLAFHTVHTPLDAKPEVVDKFRRKLHGLNMSEDDRQQFGSRSYQNLPEYAAMVYHMDENIGRLLTALDQFGLRENTIVIFTSDNGGKNSVTSNAPLRGAKHNLYEGGIRVPMIIRYPAKVEAGSESSVPLISDDFYPTLLDMTGLPLEQQQHLDGKSFKQVAFKGKNKNIHNALFWHYPHSRYEGAIRWKNYKLIYEYKTGISELYDLREDIGERNNIAQTDSKITKKLRTKLGKWLEKTGARFPDEDLILP